MRRASSKFDPDTLYPAHGLYYNAVEVPAGMAQRQSFS